MGHAVHALPDHAEQVVGREHWGRAAGLHEASLLALQKHALVRLDARPRVVARPGVGRVPAHGDVRSGHAVGHPAAEPSGARCGLGCVAGGRCGGEASWPADRVLRSHFWQGSGLPMMDASKGNIGGSELPALPARLGSLFRGLHFWGCASVAPRTRGGCSTLTSITGYARARGAGMFRADWDSLRPAYRAFRLMQDATAPRLLVDSGACHGSRAGACFVSVPRVQAQARARVPGPSWRTQDRIKGPGVAKSGREGRLGQALPSVSAA